MGVEKASYGLKYAIRWHSVTSLALCHVVGTLSRRWHSVTSLALCHVVGTLSRRWHNTNFAQTTKKRFFFKKNSVKILLFAKFGVPLHRLKR